MTQEDQWIKRIDQGDPGAADELIASYYGDILRYCRYHLPDPGLAEDAAQETFLKFIRYIDRYTHRGRLKPFLYQIAANTCIDLLRKAPPDGLSVEELAPELGYLEPGIERVHQEVAFRQMIRSLPPEQQEIVLLRFGQDLTLREIGQVLHLPFRTVQSRLRAALKRLKQTFEQEELYERSEF